MGYYKRDIEQVKRHEALLEILYRHYVLASSGLGFGLITCKKRIRRKTSKEEEQCNPDKCGSSNGYKSRAMGYWLV